MLYREIIAVCSEIHTKHINSLCGQNVELWNVKICGIYSNHWADLTIPTSPITQYALPPPEAPCIYPRWCSTTLKALTC